MTVLCACNNQSCETIKINIHGDKRLVLEQPNLRENNLFDCSPFKYYDNSNKWSLVEQSEKVGMKFVIENKKTGMVLEEADTIQMGEWEDNDSQLWLLKPQTESGYSIVNIASG